MNVQTLPVIDVWPGELDDFANASSREWLVTNGLGGFASGTVSGARTRRYHGLLMAALRPPVERTLLVANLDVTVEYAGKGFCLATNEFHDGTIHPSGYAFIERFRLAGSVPTWSYRLDDAVLTQSVWMAPGANTTHVRLHAARTSEPLRLRVRPLCAYRDYHSHQHGGTDPDVAGIPEGIEIRAFADAVPYRILTDRGEYTHDPAWHWGFRHRMETRRGLDDLEDLFRPGEFVVELCDGESVTFSLTTESERQDPERSLASVERRSRRTLDALPPGAPWWIRQLSLAADQFVVARCTEGPPGRTLIAGYPWFADWGRDTMIALPGIALATGRFDAAAEILRTFARHVDRGMLPNRFPDRGEAVEYNTVDATLWYFHAIDRYLRYSGDCAILPDLYPVLVDIIDWHERGTRYGIGMDGADGLLSAGEPGVQLTWMDARVGERVITPRIGKPVEINALWYQALVILQSFATALGDASSAERCQRMAARVAASFERRYWNETRQALYDVIDGPDGHLNEAGERVDASLRPNQIIAVAVAPDLLDRARARAVVDTCARRLWTPLGLRSLAEDEPGYLGRYAGGPGERDGAYHQGTVWSWLLGPFALAHFYAYGDAAAARSWLSGMKGHLRQACIGQVSEIFEGQPPHRPDGCFAQAWGAAEVLRAWLEIGQQDNNTGTEDDHG